jgi:hypothetical protein
MEDPRKAHELIKPKTLIFTGPEAGAVFYTAG